MGNDPLIQNRARYYVRDKYHKLKNAPYVDNSYKWAGGGFLSSVGDLLRFGSMMLYSFQQIKVTSKTKSEASGDKDGDTNSKPLQTAPPPSSPDSPGSVPER